MYNVLIGILFYSTLAFSTEVDSFSQRHIGLQDSAPQLNRLVDLWLDDVEQRQINCDEDRLVRAAVKRFARFGWSRFETAVVLDELIPQHRPVEDHIYSDFNTSLQLPFTISTLLFVEGVWIGADKFSHFFTEGHNYYKRFKKFDGNMNQVFKYGHDMEAGIWGLKSTGVYSYADLVANFEGLKFFKSLHRGERPYFACIQGTWKKVRSFQWSDYVNYGWDEGINCNRFLNEELTRLHSERIKNLENRFEMNLSCPIKPAKCDELKAKYRFHTDHFLSPECR